MFFNCDDSEAAVRGRIHAESLRDKAGTSVGWRRTIERVREEVVRGHELAQGADGGCVQVEYGRYVMAFMYKFLLEVRISCGRFAKHCGRHLQDSGIPPGKYILPVQI